MMLSQHYKNLIGRCAVLFSAGTALQFLVGSLNPSFLAYPWGIVLAVNYLYVLILLYCQADKWKWVKGWYDRSACIVSLASLLVLSLLFGLIRQDASTDGLWGMLGFTEMTTSWTFNFFLIHFMTVMGLKSIDDVWHWKKRNLSVIVFHVAVFVVLVSGIFGSGDKIRVKVVATVGNPVQYGVSSDNKRVELPFVLRLTDFTLEEYPPRIHRVSENQLSKAFVVIEDENDKGILDSWQVECLKYLDMAGRLHSDSAYIPMKHVGATSAIYVKASHTETHQMVEGWISCGSHIFDGSALALPDGTALVMPRREVKKYLSSIELLTNEGKEHLEIAVNHPATIGSWKIYQSGYDSDRGRWSTLSVLECVKDAWYMPVCVALWLILAAGVWMLFHGWTQRRKRKEDKV